MIQCDVVGDVASNEATASQNFFYLKKCIHMNILKYFKNMITTILFLYFMIENFFKKVLFINLLRTMQRKFKIYFL